MAITIQQQPINFQPVYNPQWWAATSTQFAQPNFTYTIKVTDMITGFMETYQYSPSPTGPLTFNSETFAELRMKNFVPINVYGWKVCTDALRQIKVNIGETYDVVGVPTYFAGVDIFYQVWNGALSFLVNQSYNKNNYVSDTLILPPNVVWLTDTLPEHVFYNRSNLLYKLRNGVNSATLAIDIFDTIGNFLGRSLIYEPQGIVYSDRYLCIDVGLKGLANTTPDYGYSPMIPALPTEIGFYEISDVVITGFTMGGDPILGTETFIKRYTVKCQPRTRVITLHALLRNGHYRTVHCDLVSELSTDIKRNTFKQLPFDIAALGSVSYKYNAGVEQTLNVETQNKIKVQTDWLTEAESALYMEVASSPDILMDLGTGQGYARMRCSDGSYATRQRYPDGLFTATFQLEYTHTDNRQRA